MKKRYTCDRCENGLKREYSHIDNGICWKCNGVGSLPYNPEPIGTGKEDDSLQERMQIQQWQEEEQAESKRAWQAVNGFLDDDENYYHG